jgi:hypothetical protein
MVDARLSRDGGHLMCIGEIETRPYIFSALKLKTGTTRNPLGCQAPLVGLVIG